MIWLLQLMLVLMIFITSCFLVYFSLLSRRKNIGDALRFRHRARMNISMGLCFLAWAGLQFTMASTHMMRDVLIILILLIGVINLYYGIKRLNWLNKKEAQKAGS